MDANTAVAQVAALVKVIDKRIEVHIMIGNMPIGLLLEDNDRWFIADANYKALGIQGYNTKQEALNAFCEYMQAT